MNSNTVNHEGGVTGQARAGELSRWSAHKLRTIRSMLCIVIVGLILSGVTAIPLESELKLLTQLVSADGATEQGGFAGWFALVYEGLRETNANYPFLAYGTDWLAFAHFVIAIVFIGPWRDPVRNIWVVEFGMIACALVIPYALIMGGFRGIPFGWRLIDCSFGIFGILPLWYCRRLIKQLEALVALVATNAGSGLQ